MSNALTMQVTDGIAVVTFDLPGESVNKFTPSVITEFTGIIEQIEIGIDAERTRLATATVAPHAWTTITADVPAALRGTVQRVFLAPRRTWSPAAHGVRDDQRSLGVSVRRIWTE